MGGVPDGACYMVAPDGTDTGPKGRNEGKDKRQICGPSGAYLDPFGPRANLKKWPKRPRFRGPSSDGFVPT